MTSLTDEEIEFYTEMFYEPQEFTQEEVEEITRIDFYLV